MTLSSKIISAALIAALLPSLVLPATAAPVASPHGLQNVVTPSVEAVQYRRGGRGFRGGGFAGPAVGLGIAGALIGGAIIGATQPYGPYGYYGNPYGYYGNGGYYGYPAPGYPAPGYVAVAPPYPVGDAIAYCMQRFHSYDPSSGTYLGFDGYRHPCP
jgi:hypothetical protein